MGILGRTFFTSLLICCVHNTYGQIKEQSAWPNYGNDPGGMRHSPLTQVNRANVEKLKVAWVFHTGDISEGHDDRKRSGFETTPILVDGKIIGAIGVSGALSSQDAQVAKIGADALAR